MEQFQDSTHLQGLRIRSYFRLFEEAGTIESEGAFRITLVNTGDQDVNLGSDNDNFLLPALTGIGVDTGQAFANTLVLDGSPYMVRDDEIPFTFMGTGQRPSLSIVYDRVLPKREDNTYPGERYDND